ncbi:MAG: hypothetical protein ABWY06_23010 [Pseudomonas sp.]|uniref:hypothetical protein n=1 Tax=Pseudomonas sp. TaxID=306 RepID=UPI003399C8C0
MNTPGLIDPCSPPRFAAMLAIQAASDVHDSWPEETGRWLAGGIPGQPGPDTPAEPGLPPEQPAEPGSPTLPDQPPPAPVV